jgi:predicted RND superfamily exporter protein
LLLLFVGFFIAQIPNFQLDASSDSLVLEGDNNLRYYQSIRKNYGSDDYLVISYQVKDNLLAPKQLKHLASLKKDLQAIEQVKSVTTILDVPLLNLCDKKANKQQQQYNAVARFFDNGIIKIFHRLRLLEFKVFCCF